MLYQSQKDEWPLDRSCARIFFLQAIERICTEFEPNWTGPRTLYPTKFLPTVFGNTKRDRELAAELLSWHEPYRTVKMIYLPLDDSVPSYIEQDYFDYDVTAEHWSRVCELDALIRSQTPDDVGAIFDALEKFAGAAAKGEVATFQRSIQSNAMDGLHPEDWSVSRQVLAARYAFGQIDRAKLNTDQPCGTHHIFVDEVSFRSWLSALNGMSKLTQGELFVDCLAQSHRDGRPPGNKRAVMEHLTHVIQLSTTQAGDIWRRKAPNHWKISGAPRGAPRN